MNYYDYFFNADAEYGRFGLFDDPTAITYNSSGVVNVPVAALDFSLGTAAGRYYDSGWVLNKVKTNDVEFTHGLGSIPTYVKVLVRENGTTENVMEATVVYSPVRGTYLDKMSTTKIYVHVGDTYTMVGNTVGATYAGAVDIRVFAWK